MNLTCELLVPNWADHADVRVAAGVFVEFLDPDAGKGSHAPEGLGG